jgi:hypothetical protein
LIDTNSFIGVPYKLNGDNVKDGFDCWTFIKHIYGNVLNRNVPDYVIGDISTIKTKIDTCRQYMEDKVWVKQDAPEDYVAVAMSKNKYIHHIGIWYKNACLHCVEHMGVVYNDYNSLKRNGYNRIEFYKHCGS